MELKARDGSTSLLGELLGVEDGFYIIRTEIGELKINIASATCEGISCPAESQGEGFAIHVAPGIGLKLASEIIRGYASETDADVEFLESDRADRQIIRMTRRTTGQSTEIVFFSGQSGFSSMVNGEAQLTLQDTPMREEIDPIFSGPALDQLLSPENEQTVALDAVIVAVNPENPVRYLSKAEIAGIFSGEISNWLELGGGNRPISVHALEPSHVRGELFSKRVMGSGNLLSNNVNLVQSDREVLAEVRSDPGAIGFLSRSGAESARPIAIRESCGLITRPNSFQLKTNGYPLTYPVFLYRRPAEIHSEAEGLVDWLATEDSQSAIRRAGFVDRNLERMNLEDMGMMLIHTAAVEPDFSPGQYSEMMRELRDAERLSLSFRFRTGSSALDERSLANLEVLGRRMEAREFAGLEMLIVGFADAIGSQARNTQLAAQRAQSVRNILVRSVSPETTSRLRLRTLSYGELLPVACNQDEAGRELNRRVEIWVRRPGVREIGR